MAYLDRFSHFYDKVHLHEQNILTCSFIYFFSAGITLDHSNTNRLVLSRLSSNNQFEIEIWTTKNNGKTWTVEIVTKNSMNLNVRPIIPRFHNTMDENLLILWMSGQYQYWTNYSTSIKYKFVKQ